MAWFLFPIVELMSYPKTSRRLRNYGYHYQEEIKGIGRKILSNGPWFLLLQHRIIKP